MTPLDIPQLKIRRSKYTAVRAESPGGGIKTFCHNGGANTLHNTLPSEGKIIFTNRGEGNLRQSKSLGNLRGTSRSTSPSITWTLPSLLWWHRIRTFAKPPYRSFWAKRIEAGNVVLLLRIASIWWAVGRRILDDSSDGGISCVLKREAGAITGANLNTNISWLMCLPWA